MEFIKLFEPITINKLTVKNRIAMPAMALGYTHDFSFNERLKAFYRSRAKGGVGLMTIGPLAIDPDAVYPNMPGLFNDDQVEVLKAFLDELHRETDVKVAIQLMHMGRNAVPMSGVQSLGPSPIPGKMTGQVPREMTIEDIKTAINQFAQSAIKAQTAGFDLIEIIACTGYLISQFLSPLSNQRHDKYGGTPENRMRFGLEVIAAIRAVIGTDYPIGIRIAGNDFLEGGSTNQDACLFAAEAEKAGADVINVTGGWHETYIPQLTTNVPPGAFLYLAGRIRESVQIPVMASNRLGNPIVAEKALRTGICDMICWGRPLIADPELPDKAQAGRLNEAVFCIACNQGCFDAVISGQPVHCVLNPMAGREDEFTLKPVNSPKAVMVAGGGPAGMEFAITAARLGHQVSLYEKADHLGGQLVQAQASPGKRELGNIVTSMKGRMAEAAVDLHLNTELNVKTVKQEKPDVLVVATGAHPMKISVPGINKPHVINAWDILDDSFWDIGQDVVIVGGSATGCETAHKIASMKHPDSDVISFLSYHQAEDAEQMKKLQHDSGRNITIIDIVPRMAGNVGPTSRWSLMKSLNLSGVVMKTGTRLLEIADAEVIVEVGQKKESIKADTVVLAIGAVSVNHLVSELSGEPVHVVTIGDAASPRRITEAVREGFEAALKLT